LLYLVYEFDVHVTVQCDKFPYYKPTRCTNFSRSSASSWFII